MILSLTALLVTALMTPISEEVLDAADFVVPCITTNRDLETSLSGPGEIRQYWNILINETVKRQLLNKTLKEEFYKYYDSDPTTWGKVNGKILFIIYRSCGKCYVNLIISHTHLLTHTHTYTLSHSHTITHTLARTHSNTYSCTAAYSFAHAPKYSQMRYNGIWVSIK